MPGETAMTAFSSLMNFLQQLRDDLFPGRAASPPLQRQKDRRPDIPPGSTKQHVTPPEDTPQVHMPADPVKRHRKEINQFPPAKVYARGRHEVKTRHEDGPPAAKGKGPQRGGKNK